MDPSNPPPPQSPQQLPPPPTIPMPVVQVQSLTPTGGAVSSPLVATPSSAIPVVAPVQEEGDLVDEINEPPVFYNTAVTPSRQSNLLVEYWRKVGGGSFLLSILIHVGLFALAALIVIPQLMVKQPVDFLPGGGSKAGDQASAQLQQNVKNKKRSSLNKQTPMKKVVSNSTTSNIALPEVPMDAIDMPEMSSLLGGAMGSGGFGNAGSGGGFGKGIGAGGQSGFVSLPPSMKSRCSSAERLQKLRESGGTAECERAVSNALAYLKSKQKPDGSWGTQHKSAMTGFALLCFLGRCETPDSPFYGENVMKGIMFLLETQKKNPHGMFSQATSGNGPAYEHGIATYALGEMYTLARMGSKTLPGMREAFEKGVEVIIENQGKHGSWVYDTEKGSYAPNSREDLSVAGWQYQALKAAKLTSLKINGLHQSISNTVDYLKKKQTKDGGIGGSNREAHYNQWELTGTGVLGLQTLGGGGHKTEIKKGIAFARELFTKEPPDWANNTIYSTYYYQQAFFQAGGDDWKFWNEQYLQQILKAQKPDGSWQHAKTSTGGDWIYSTALNTLMLEVYYRYLKVADRESGSVFDR
jgi:hypothetical protein